MQIFFKCNSDQYLSTYSQIYFGVGKANKICILGEKKQTKNCASWGKAGLVKNSQPCLPQGLNGPSCCCYCCIAVCLYSSSSCHGVSHTQLLLAQCRAGTAQHRTAVAGAKTPGERAFGHLL